MIKNIYGITELNTKIKIGEYDDGIVIRPVGGRIFYIDSNSDEDVRFYDSQGNVISNVGVGDTPYGYAVINQGTSGKDKFYVYNSSISNAGKRWGYFEITTNATGLNIGDGRINTNLVSNITDTSGESNTMWIWLDEQNDDNLGECNDWYIGSKGELEELRLYLVANADGSTIINFFSTYSVFSSSEVNDESSWGYTGGNSGSWSSRWRPNNSLRVCAIRSF